MSCKKVVVTGFSGLVGRAIINVLQNNREVIGVNYMGEEKLTWFDNVSIDLSNKSIVEKIDLMQVDTIIHCAALIPNEINSFEKCRLINSKIDENIYNTLLENEHIQLVFISTANLYRMGTSKITEASELSLTNDYMAGKVDSEMMYSSLKNKTVMLRINAPYHYSMTANTVLKIFIEKALSNQDIFFHGSGNRMQDFTHTTDIAHAVLNSISNSGANGIYNISSGVPISMKELAILVVDTVPECTSNVLASGQPDLQENYKALFDITKAEKELHWKPNISIKEGVEEWIEKCKK